MNQSFRNPKDNCLLQLFVVNAVAFLIKTEAFHSLHRLPETPFYMQKTKNSSIDTT